VAATLVPIGALAWLGVRILGQDRDLERQRRRESLEFAAGRLATDVERSLAEVEERLAEGSGVRFTDSGFEPDPAVLYDPQPSRSKLAASSLFSDAESLEFQRRDLAAAAAACAG